MSNVTRTPKWALGMQKIAPGVYVDEAGALHICGREVCEFQGVPATPENLQKVEDDAAEVLRQLGGGRNVKCIPVDDTDP